jgi:hypothetical protein
LGDELIKKMQDIYTMEYYSSIKGGNPVIYDKVDGN